MPETPFEKLRKSNGDYHEAFDEIMRIEIEDKMLAATRKASLGTQINHIFNMMVMVDKLLVDWGYLE
ncbi:MAG: hypothetical protein ABID54_07340 [Pseudomonadota bacterium]